MGHFEAAVDLRLVIALALAICTAGRDVSFHQNVQQVCTFKDPIMNATLEVLHGQDTVWQIPPSPKAILFLAHGLFRDSYSYFDRSPGCDKCYGLPEDRTLTLDALRRGYAVISMKSIEDHYNNWPIETSQDALVLENILHDWRLEHSLESLPLVMFGNSAGGFFASAVVTRIPAVALILMCSQGQAEVIENANPETFPPTFFNYVGNHSLEKSCKLGQSSRLSDHDEKSCKLGQSSRLSDHDEKSCKLGQNRFPTDYSDLPADIPSKADVEKAMAVLRDRGVPVDGRCGSPRPVNPLYFTERVPCMTSEDSQKIQRAYKAEGWLDSENYLTLDPHDGVWTAPLRKWNAMPVWYKPAIDCNNDGECTGVCGRDAVCQELMRAYAFHGCNGDANEEMYSWVDSILACSHNQKIAVV